MKQSLCSECSSPVAPSQERCYWCQVRTEPGFHISTVRSRILASSEDEIITEVLKPAPSEAADRAEFLTDARATRQEGFSLDGLQLLGRTHEIQTLDAAWAEICATGSHKLLAIRGPAGVGKTRLVACWLEAATHREQRPLVYFHGSSGGGEARQPGGVLARLVRTAISANESSPANELRAKLDTWVESHTPRQQRGAAKSLLARLCGTPYPGTGAYDTPTVLVRRTARVLAAAITGASQGRPFVLWIDDLEALARQESEILALLLRRLQDTPSLCLLAGEPAEDACLWEPADCPETLELEALDTAASEALVQALVSPGKAMPPSLLEVVLSRAKGLPGAIVEALQLLAGHGILHWMKDGWRVDAASVNPLDLPEDLGLLLDSRLAMLDPDSLILLQTAAVAGLRFPLSSLLACIPGAERESVLRARVLELQRQDLIRFDEGDASDPHISFSFRAESQRERVLAGMGAEDQASIHRRFASWWSGHHRADRLSEVRRVAMHWEQGQRPGKAAPWHLLAAQIAAERYDNAEANLCLARALDALDPEDAAARVPVLHESAKLGLRSGDWDVALAAYREMASEAAFVGQGGPAAEALLGEGRVHHRRGDWRRALERVREARRCFETFGDLLAVARCLDAQGQIRLHSGTPRSRDEAQADFELALKLRDEAGDAGGVAQSYHNLGWVYGDRGRFEEASLCYEQAIRMRRELGDRENLARSLNNLGDTLLAAGDHEAARRLLSEALAEAEAIGAAAIRSVVMANLARSFLDSQQLDEADTWIARVHECLQERDDRYGMVDLHLLRSRLFQARGDHADAMEEAQSAADLVEIMEGGELHGVVLRRMGELLSATLYTPDEGTPRDQQAEDYFQRSLLALQASGHDIEMARTLKSYGEYLLERGKRRSGQELLRRAAALLQLDESQEESVD